MKRFSYCLLTLAIAMISLIGCGKEADEKKEDTIVAEEKIPQEEAVKEEVMPEGTRATKEFIMEEYHLTEEDIEGIDVEAILEYYKYSEDDYKECGNIVLILRNMQRNMIKEINGKLYLIKGTSFTGENLDVSTLRYLTYIRGEVELAYVCLIDVEQKEMNWGTGGEQYLEYYPERIKTKFTLTEEEIAGLIQVLEKNEVWNWKAEYRSEQEQQITDWGWWRIGMEFADGTIITVWGSVISDKKSKPEWYDEVVEYIGKIGTKVK